MNARIAAASALVAVAGSAAVGLTARAVADPADHRPERAARVEVLAPSRGDVAGEEGKGWVVDLAVDFRTDVRASGLSGLQLTGPGVHAGTAPFPGTFSTGRDDRLPGLVVLASTTTDARPGFSGPGTNLANLFNLTGLADRSARHTRVWDTWIVGADIAGRDVDTTLTVAVVADLDHNGVLDDAPATVEDADHDGDVDARDLRALGVASNVATVRFHVDGATAA